MRKIVRAFDRALFALVTLGLIVAWEGGVRLLSVPPIVLPPPSGVVRALIEGFKRGIYLQSILITGGETLLGFAISAGIGVALGALLSEFRPLYRLTYPYFVLLQSVPKVAIAPLILVWMGFGTSSKVATAVLVSFFAVLVNTLEGFRAIEPDQLELMRGLRCSRWQTFRLVRLPSALPNIMAGLELALLFSLLGAIVGEFVGAQKGLGVTLLAQQGNLDVPGMFATLSILSVFGLTLHFAFLKLRRRVVFWQPETKLNVSA